MKKIKTRQELATEYGISRKTLARRLDSVGIKLSLARGVLLPIDLLNVYQALGLPEKMPVEEKAGWSEELKTRN